METVTNSQLKLAHDFVEYTSTNIFLTGKAGTGKTTFLHKLREVSNKRLIVVAPTGVAAINAKGETIHSFFQIGFAPYIPGQENSQNSKIRRFNRTKIAILRSLDLLVIDEISMVRADLLDSIDVVLRRFKDRDKPFGGVQLLMIGDLQQLAPVVKNEEWELLKGYYDSPYFFDSHALRQTLYACIELKHIYRQQNIEFIELLEKVRTANLDNQAIELLNTRYVPDFKAPKNKNYITLTSHNNTARKINESKLTALKHEEYCFEAEVRDNFPEWLYPVDFNLRLKQGAQVMFTKNDHSPEKRYVNGTIGIIVRLDEDTIEIAPSDGSANVIVEPAQWENSHYTLNEQTKEIEETIDGIFTQYPLKTAWAITIHKSQGLTFDYTIIDAADAFSHGQVYVALSRCRTLEGIVLRSRLNHSAVISDYKIRSYMSAVDNNPVGEQRLAQQKRAYFSQILCQMYDCEGLRRDLRSLHKLIRESIAGSYPKLAVRWNEEFPAIDEQICKVGDKFQTQIRSLITDNYEENAVLKERIAKGSVYFLAKFDELLLPLVRSSKVSIEAKIPKKQLANLLDKLDEQLRVKLALMKIPAQEFSINTYLKTKALALLEKEKTAGFKPEILTKKSTPKIEESSDIQNPELMEHLVSWRRVKASERNVPAYVVATQKALIGLSNYIPTNKAEMKNIKGIGPVFINTYGREIIEIMDDYRMGKI